MPGPRPRAMNAAGRSDGVDLYNLAFMLEARGQPGRHRIKAADASPYEDAQIVHDFNNPVPIRLHQRFDTIFDGGALEHIFNVPTLRVACSPVNSGG